MSHAPRYPSAGSQTSPVDPAGAGPVCDFVGGAFGHRLRAGFGRGQPLARAVGLRPGEGARVVDATAGLGRDAFLLASLGLDVTLIERVPAIHSALAEGLARAAAAGPAHAAVVARMTLLQGDARDLIPALRPAVVLVDPMHPARAKSALVKQGLRQVRALVGPDADAADLMRVALASARRRVVLKWPLRGAPLAGLPAPSHAILTKTLRFDVFLRMLPPSAAAGS